jgi:hypothetical protein
MTENEIKSAPKYRPEQVAAQLGGRRTGPLNAERNIGERPSSGPLHFCCVRAGARRRIGFRAQRRVKLLYR